MTKLRALLASLGPGLLFAGAAIGVSHLVYASRAGALYGFGLFWALVLSHLCKYPFFEFGSRYAALEEENLLQGYKRLGPWALWLFLLISLGTMFTVQAAVTLVAAALAVELFGFSVQLWFFLLLGLSALLVFRGQYKQLDAAMKPLVLLLSFLTLLCLFFAFANRVGEPLSLAQYLPREPTDILFLIALMGWMPAPLDLSVWHSLWSLEKNKELQEGQSAKRLAQGLFDFRVGYIGTFCLATCFLLLGALAWQGSGEEIPTTAGGFSSALIAIYSKSIGPGIGYVVALAAFATMFSTVLTCMDALPRSLKAWQDARSGRSNSQQWPWLLLLLVGTALLYLLFFDNFSSFLGLATALSFLSAPFLAWLNLRLMQKRRISLPPWLRLLAYLGLVYLLAFCALYLWTFF